MRILAFSKYSRAKTVAWIQTLSLVSILLKERFDLFTFALKMRKVMF